MALVLENRRWLRDLGLVPELGRSHGGGHGNPLQYYFLENPMDRGAWWATVHGVAKSQTWLKGPWLQCVYTLWCCCWSLNFKCSSHFLHLYSPVLTISGFISYLCEDDFLLVLYVCTYWWAFPFLIFLFLIVASFIPPREVPLAFFWKTDLVVLNSVSFCLSVKFLILPSNLN